MERISSGTHRPNVFQQARIDLARLRAETNQCHLSNEEILANQEEPNPFRAALAKTQEGILRQGGA